MTVLPEVRWARVTTPQARNAHAWTPDQHRPGLWRCVCGSYQPLVDEWLAQPGVRRPCRVCAGAVEALRPDVAVPGGRL